MPNKNLQREDFVRLLYEMAAELDDRPKEIGFPYNLIAAPVEFTLDRLVDCVSNRVLAFEDRVRPWAEPLQAKFRPKSKSMP